MNSIIQCLSHIVKLRDYSIQSEYNRQLNKKSPLQGKLVKGLFNSCILKACVIEVRIRSKANQSFRLFTLISVALFPFLLTICFIKTVTR